ncbi:MAG: glycolate oxidase subunit GlcD [Clostridiales bacterium]|nr:MAG: glycolate oxidase subunit GlcD [Clostridiales bacterium]
MLGEQLKNEFEAAVGAENVLTQYEDLVCYSFDATMNVDPQVPLAVVIPESSQQISEIVKIAKREKIPLFPRGAGTNLSGGTVPVDKGIVISMCKMNKIIEIDEDNLTATVQAGVVIEELINAAKKVGLLYAPDPGTVHCATMGGSIGECAGGLRGVKYGVTRDYVMGVEVVTSDGKIVRFGGKTVKNVTGYSMTQLFVASEGTIGIMTEAIVKLIPLPEFRRSMMAVFMNLEAAGKAISAIIRNHIIPATLEIMDNATIRCVEESTNVGLPLDAEAVLMIEVDGFEGEVVRDAERIVKICEDYGAARIEKADTDAARDKLWAARRAALPSLIRRAKSTILEDATVPRSKVAEMLKAVSEISNKYDVPIGTFGHAGDGNLHPTILADFSREGEHEKVEAAINDIFDVALSLGGTLSGEHGIGLAKINYMKNEFGDDGLDVMRKIKKALDPDNILNPGKLIPMDGGDL